MLGYLHTSLLRELANDEEGEEKDDFPNEPLGILCFCIDCGTTLIGIIIQSHSFIHPTPKQHLLPPSTPTTTHRVCMCKRAHPAQHTHAHRTKSSEELSHQHILHSLKVYHHWLGLYGASIVRLHTLIPYLPRTVFWL